MFSKRKAERANKSNAADAGNHRSLIWAILAGSADRKRSTLKNMKNNKEIINFPSRKISETFLEFSMPLIEALGENPSKKEIEKILQVTYTVWNSTIIDKVKNNNKLINMLMKSVQNDSEARTIIEELISRKHKMFSDDLRLIGNYTLKEKHKEWRLQVEARDPFIQK